MLPRTSLLTSKPGICVVDLSTQKEEQLAVPDGAYEGRIFRG